MKNLYQFQPHCSAAQALSISKQPPLRRHLIKIGLLLCLLSTVWTSDLQAQDSLSNVINSYARVTAIQSSTCAVSLEVEDTTGFQKGMDAIILQMKGAVMTESNDADFGNIEDTLSLGRYERIRIDSVSENEIFLFVDLVNEYDPAGKLQLITLPVYQTAIVVDTLRPAPWNGATGGVIALEVTDSLFLNAPIIASGMGFRGGEAKTVSPNDCSFLIIQRSYFYEDDNWRGALKGEGVVDIILGKEAGRGPQANGGGGGNDHNSGGGGGGNLTDGGQGGRNNEPSTFGCKGRSPGLGGKAIPLAAAPLLGGGGGAGHGNNDVATDGGNGGGILFLLAGHIFSNGETLASDGQSPPSTQGDGGGGGGAAGAIVLEIAEISGMLNISLEGGAGGSIANLPNRCVGPGGGGSGGLLLWDTTQTILEFPTSIALQGGLSGVSGNCGSSPNQATAGAAGLIRPFDGLMEGQPISGGGAVSIDREPESVFLCRSEAASFQVLASGINVRYQWQVDRGNGWENVQNNAIFSGSTTNTLNLSSVTAVVSTWSFRCVAISICVAQISREVQASLSIAPEIIQEPLLPAVICQGDNLRLSVQASGNGLSFQWQFLQNSIFEDLPESALFQGTNSNVLNINGIADAITIRCQITDDCGERLTTIVLDVDVQAFPTANFFFQINDKTAQFINNSSAGDYAWSFGDGQTANTSDPMHTYQEAGDYPVQLEVSNDCGTAIFVDTIRILNLLPPEAIIALGQAGGCAPFTVQFSDQSPQLVESWEWQFPGGQPAVSQDSAPVVVYTDPGLYDVLLEVRNAAGSASSIRNALVEVVPTPLARFTYEVDGRVVRFTNLSEGTDEFQWNFDDGSPISSERDPVHEYAANGVYNVRLSAQNVYCSSILGEDIQILVVSTEEISESEGLVIYPNPTRDYFHLQYKDLTVFEWRLFDGFGRLIQQSQPAQGWDRRIEVGQLPEAVYWLKVETDKGQVVRPLVKLR
ncbi:MAG: PKD domain-containing protein [Bacteroidota bacterium]